MLARLCGCRNRKRKQMETKDPVTKIKEHEQKEEKEEEEEEETKQGNEKKFFVTKPVTPALFEKSGIPLVLDRHILDFLSVPETLAIRSVSKKWQTLPAMHHKSWHNVSIPRISWLHDSPYRDARRLSVVLDSLLVMCRQHMKQFEMRDGPIDTICKSLMEHQITGLQSLKLEDTSDGLVEPQSNPVSMTTLLKLVKQNPHLVELTTPWHSLLGCDNREVEKRIYKKIQKWIPAVDEDVKQWCRVCTIRAAGCPCCHAECAGCDAYPCSDCGTNECEKCGTTYCDACGLSEECVDGECEQQQQEEKKEAAQSLN